MKCPMCGGDGITDKFTPNVGRCIKCNGSGKIEPTNEEYLRYCNTEQLADVFFDYRYINATPRQKLWMSASEECIKTDIVEWLKQPRNSSK